MQERVLKEVSLLKACRSQHIVSFQGVCFQQGEVQLVTELMAGGNLFEALRNGQLNWYNGWVAVLRLMLSAVAA